VQVLQGPACLQKDVPNILLAKVFAGRLAPLDDIVEVSAVAPLQNYPQSLRAVITEVAVAAHDIWVV
jgi:hypothetical protein